MLARLKPELKKRREVERASLREIFWPLEKFVSGPDVGNVSTKSFHDSKIISQVIKRAKTVKHEIRVLEKCSRLVSKKNERERETQKVTKLKRKVQTIAKNEKESSVS